MAPDRRVLWARWIALGNGDLELAPAISTPVWVDGR